MPLEQERLLAQASGNWRIHEIIDEFISAKGWGEIVISVEGGKVVLVRKAETIKFSPVTGEKLGAGCY